MAFTPLDLKIFPKGLNLLPPGDQVADGDCLALDGWWPGSAGKLQQAKGWTQKNAVDTAGNLDSLEECQGRVYYGGNGILWQIGRDGGGASIDASYDQFPLGLCAFQNVMWIMNRSKQRRDDGATVSDWGTEVPGAPVNTPASGGGLPDGTHFYYVTWVDIYGYESNPSPVADAALPPGAFSSGTVQVATDSSTITLTGSTWSGGITGQTFQVAGDDTQYVVTFVDATHATLNTPFTGQSDSAANFAIFSNANTSSNAVARPTAATPSLIRGWNVYRESPGSGSIYQVNATEIPYATTSYTDYGDATHKQDQETLIANDVVMEADHDAPPAARVMASRPYNGRLVVASSATYPNRIWYTRPLEPNYFPGSASSQTGQWVDIGNDSGDAILHMSVRAGMLIVYRQRSIWRVTGDLGDINSVIAPLIPNMGIAGPRSVVGTTNGDIALVKQGGLNFGLYRVTDWEQRVSQKVEPIFTGTGSECYSPMSTLGSGGPLGNVTGTCAMGFLLGRLWFSYPDANNTVPTRTLICDIEQDQFSVSVAGRWFARAGGFGCFLHGSQSFYATSGGRVLALEDGYTENGSPTALVYQSKYEDAGNPDREKTFGDLIVKHNTQGAVWTVEIRRNQNAEAITLGTITSTVLTRQAIPLEYPAGYPVVGLRGQPIEAFNLAVRISGNAPTGIAPAEIDGPLLLHYYLKPRAVTQWDSGPTDHGITGPKIVDAVEVDMDGPAMVLMVWSDIPGGVLTLRTPPGGVVVPSTNGRQVQRVVLPAPILGRICRYQLFAQGSAPFSPTILYRVRVRALPVGVFADGTFGDSWYTEPIAA